MKRGKSINKQSGNNSVTLLKYNGGIGVGVAASEDDIIHDQQERDSLLRSIASAETALAVSAPSTRRILENLIEGAKGRVATLDTKIKDDQEAHAREQSTTVLLAQKEAALTTREQAEYSGFLKEDFFTKRDFGRLEHFYAGTWDRLSKEGKEEMSHRVWEGIRHDEYRFTDLPKDVREKEEDRIYSKLSDPAKVQDSMGRIRENDRADFVRAYDAGNRNEAGQVLNREGFRKNTALKTASVIQHQSPTVGNAANDDSLLAANRLPQSGAAIVKPTAADGASLANVKLNGVVLVDSNSAPSAAAIPDASGSRVNGRSPA